MDRKRARLIRKSKQGMTMEAGHELGYFRSLKELKTLAAVGKKRNKKDSGCDNSV